MEDQEPLYDVLTAAVTGDTQIRAVQADGSECCTAKAATALQRGGV